MSSCKHDLDFSELNADQREQTIARCAAGEFEAFDAEDESLANDVVGPALPEPDEHGWHKSETWRYTPGGGYSGDDRVGTSFSAGYWKQAPGLDEQGRQLFMVVDEEYYVAQTQPDVDKPHGSLGCEASYTFTICTDREDPGSTEVWSDVSYESPGDLNALYRSSLAEAERICLRWALSDQRHTLMWDGGIPAR